VKAQKKPKASASP